MKAEYKTYLQNASKQLKGTRQFLKKLRKNVPKDLDEAFEEAHEKAFQQIDCLGCANCCKTMSPRVNNRDIKRIAKVLKMKEREFVDQYLKQDEDGDYIMNQKPCPFLQDDNKCMIYKDRPSACANFPHTNHRKMHKHLNVAANNYDRCPIVFRVIEDLKEKY